MHFPSLRILSIVASLAMLSRAYSDDVFGARDYMDELSTRTDAVLSSLSTRELIAEVSERLDRRKYEIDFQWECVNCLVISRKGPVKSKTCPKTKSRLHDWAKTSTTRVDPAT
ncbi:hypothetical protein DFP72DRAFT_1077861 [Ephemerocybe angulata]|uniref:Uncharacterized protein n=1 Tax=Ephemerocybe angulata TaxID=980116 RepID=A0A8H6LXU7_9AGAR|nr:hypothetical protein DFP72DRAFT_1077861 [Tulosesus angulatus]